MQKISRKCLRLIKQAAAITLISFGLVLVLPYSPNEITTMVFMVAWGICIAYHVNRVKEIVMDEIK